MKTPTKRARGWRKIDGAITHAINIAEQFSTSHGRMTGLQWLEMEQERLAAAGRPCEIVLNSQKKTARLVALTQGGKP